MRPCTSPARDAGAQARTPRGDDRETAPERERPVRELRRDRVLEDVLPPGRRLEHAGRRPVPAHLRKGRIDVSGLQPGDERTHDEGREDRRAREKRQSPRQARGTRGVRGAGRAALLRASRVEDVQREREQVDVDQDREREMGRQPILADPRLVDESALDHVPAEHALRAPEDEQAGEARDQRRRNRPHREKHEEREQERDTDPAPEHAVGVLHPEDALELGERHPPVDQPVLGGGAVGVELAPPGRLADRRQDSGDRMPPHHGQPRAGQPGHAAHRDHRIDQHRARDEPPSERPGRHAPGPRSRILRLRRFSHLQSRHSRRFSHDGEPDGAIVPRTGRTEGAGRRSTFGPRPRALLRSATAAKPQGVQSCDSGIGSCTFRLFVAFHTPQDATHTRGSVTARSQRSIAGVPDPTSPDAGRPRQPSFSTERASPIHGRDDALPSPTHTAT